MKPLEDLIHDLDPERLASLTDHLRSIVNPERVERVDGVLAYRTRRITVVLEDIYQSHNASAVVRSCECFGVQDIHVVESANAFSVNSSIVQGSAKWVTLKRYRGPQATDTCLDRLAESGYRIVAMDPRANSVPIDDLPIDAPVALCFGSEEPGLSAAARRKSDLAATIPMHGFTRSLNLSVSAGIALQSLGRRFRGSQEADWALSNREQAELRALWLARSLSAGARIVQRHLESPCS